MKLLHISTLVSVAAAALLEKRAVSNNNCGRAVAGTAKGAAFQSSVKADCAKNVVVYTTVLVTPTASTVYQTTATQASIQSVLLATSTSTSLATVTSFTTQTDVSVATQYSTLVQDTVQTNQIPYVATYTSTAISTLTVGAASTVTVYTAVTNTPVKRAASTIPAYASPCRSFEEYGQACALVGVTPGTSTIYSTLPTSTITSVISQTSTSTNLITSTLISGVNVIVSEFSTQTTVQTVTTTLQTIITSTQTAFSTATISTQTLVETATTQVPAAVQTVSLPIPTFKVQMTPSAGGPSLYMQIKNSDAQSIIGVTDISAGTPFTINALSEMYATTNNWVLCGFIPQANYYMEMVSRPSIANYPNYFRPMNCNIVSATNELICKFGTVSNHTIYNNQFFYSKPAFNGYTSYRAFIVPV